MGLGVRRYIRTAFFPAIRSVADILKAHGATMEVSGPRAAQCGHNSLFTAAFRFMS